MDAIRELAYQRFKIFNVNSIKEPMDKWGNKLSNWQTMSSDDLRTHHNYKCELWGMVMGLQGNGKRVMSLDFDICGAKDKSSGIRMGCEPTKEAFEDIFRNTDIQSGFFSSSTKGNFNLLVEYSKCDKLIEIIDTLGKNKFSINHLEFLINNAYQVIPPSMTKCKISEKCENQREWMSDKQFYELSETSASEDFIYNFIYKSISEKLKEKEKTPPTTPRPFQETNKDPENTPTSDKYIELLFTCMDRGNLGWQKWFQIAGIIKYNYSEEIGRRLFIKYSLLREPDENAPAKLFDSIKNNMPMSIYGLQNIAKEMNPFGYSEWLLKYKEYISVKILQLGENDVAKYIKTHLYGKLVFDGKNWWICDPSGLWRITKSPYSTFTNHIQHLIDESKKSLLYYKGTSQEREHLDKCDKMEKTYNLHYVLCGKNSFTNQIEKFLKEYLLIKDFQSLLDNYKYQIVFENGILDLKTLFFRPNIYSTDYISECLPFKWKEPTKAEIDWINKELKKICNWNDTHLAYYKSMFGYALTGDANKLQSFFYIKGEKASNGKSTILEALEKIMSLYVGKASSNAFDANNAKVHKDIATWNNKRILWANELTTKPKDAELLKAVGDGTSIPYDKLYDTKKDMAVQFKLFMISNHSFSVKMDNGIERRLKVCQLDSEFQCVEKDDYENKIFKRDEGFLDKLTGDYKFALMYVLFEASKQFSETNKLATVPKEWEDETKSTIDSNDNFKDWFNDTFEIGEEFIAPKGDVEDKLTDYKVTKMDLKDFKDTLKKMKIKWEYDKSKMVNKKKGVFYGFKLIENNFEEI